MNKMIADAIDRIYNAKDYDFFRERRKLHYNIPGELRSFAMQNEIVVVEDTHEGPLCRWTLRYKPVSKQEFKVSYTTSFLMNKIIPVFYVEHQFEVENADEERMSPYLDGFDTQPYTRSQAEVHAVIVRWLTRDGYTELSYAEMTQCVHTLSFEQDVSIFGPNVTVEDCLFNDFKGICDNGKND